MIKQSPKFSNYILRIFLRRDEFLEKVGDLEEVYFSLVELVGPFRAGMWFWFQVLKAVPVFIMNTICWRCIMWRNYTKPAWRNLMKNRVCTIINILGLSIGLACMILIYLFIKNEFLYDKFHVNLDRIYRLTTNYHNPDGSVYYINRCVIPPHGPAMKAYFPDIKYCVRIWDLNYRVKSEHMVDSESVAFVEENFFKMFTFPLIKGDPSTVLSDLNSVVLTEAWAKKYFGSEDPVGKVLTIFSDDYFNDFTVAGIVKSPPENSTIQFNLLVSFESLIQFGYRERLSSWTGAWSSPLQTYLMVDDELSAVNILNRYSEFSHQYYAQIFSDYRDPEAESGVDPLSFGLQEFRHIHLDPSAQGSPDILLTLILPGAIALIVLFIASINFITMSVGGAAKRTLEIGMRKVAGANRKQLIRQFCSESILMTMIAIIVSLGLVILLLPPFNSITQKSLSVTGLFSFFDLWVLSAMGIIIGSAIGIYPGLIISSFKTVDILRGKTKLSGKNSFIRILIVVQFTFSVFLIGSALTIEKQFNYLIRRELNFNKDGIITIKTFNNDNEESLGIFNNYRNEIQNRPGILSISGSGSQMSHGSSNDGITKDGETYVLAHNRVDYDFFKTMGMEFIEGRPFSREYSTDHLGVVLNETCVRQLGIENPIGKPFPYWRNIPFTIVGVVKDIPLEHRSVEIRPGIFYINPVIPIRYIFVKIAPHEVSKTLDFLRSSWRKLHPDVPFDYSFLDDDLEAQYLTEKKWKNIFRYSAIITIIIACMGVFGLTSITVNKRTKEIGIRKVNGASFSDIIKLLSIESIRWVLVANAIALPAAWFGKNKLLEFYSYRVDIAPLLYLFVGLLTVLLVLSTTFYHTFRAAYKNPVESIRYE